LQTVVKYAAQPNTKRLGEPMQKLDNIADSAHFREIAADGAAS